METDFHHSNFQPTVTGNPERPKLLSLWRGFLQRCPKCGIGKLFSSYLKVVPQCPHCHEELHHHRADDAPPYFTIFIVGHTIIGMVLSLEMAYHPPLWVHLVLWLPLTIAMALILLQPIKGTLVGLQWALYMHGFDPTDTGELSGTKEIL